jgi:hypothetical protein
MTRLNYEFIQPKRTDPEPYSKVSLVKLTHKYWREIRNGIIPPHLRKFLDDNNLPDRLLLPVEKPVKKMKIQKKKINKKPAR